MSNVVKIQRFFPIDSEKLFNYFVDKELLERWFAPAEMTIILKEFHPVTGGRYSYYLRGRQGLWPCEGTFREIVPSSSISMFDAFLIDPEGNVVQSNIDTKFQFENTPDGSSLSIFQTGFFNHEAASSAEISWEQRLSYLSGVIEDDESGNVEEAPPRIGHKDESHLH